jgi:hypothetical protein
MNTLYKPDGTKMEVNDNSLARALSLGWTEKNPAKKRAPKKKADTDKAE